MWRLLYYEISEEKNKLCLKGVIGDIYIYLCMCVLINTGA